VLLFPLSTPTAPQYYKIKNLKLRTLSLPTQESGLIAQVSCGIAALNLDEWEGMLHLIGNNAGYEHFLKVQKISQFFASS
jgi:hypothetical protein